MTEVEQTVTRVRRARVSFQLAIGAVCLAALGAALFAVVKNAQQDTDITSVTQKVNSACESNASGKKCQRVKREGDEARSIRDTCVAFWKVGYACPKPGSAAAERQVRSTSAGSSAPSGGGGASAPVSAGGGGDLAPASPGGGDAPAPQDSGSDPALAPPKGDVAAPSPTASSPASSPSSGGSTVTNPPPAVTSPPAPAPDPPGLIQSTVDRVDDAVTPTVCAVSELLRGTCP